ncbi:complement C4-B [Embiotoca jacksoni]|uniref:complement C4-B n=1 Tax=Embiotoca jacksoni TaxID=100190 RepID=UPI0037041B0B
MKRHIAWVLLLILAVECSAENSFFISAPNVFHVGVKEKVFVQMGMSYLNNDVTLYLEHESTGIVMSEKATTSCAGKHDIKQVELMITMEIWSRLPQKSDRHYLLLVAESLPVLERKSTRVLVSKHRGYIFIQTHQPIYNPTEKVSYRVFTLDHTMRPNEEPFHLSIFNAAGNRIMNSFKTAKGGIYKDRFSIASVSKMGTWKIKAHYDGDEAHAATREFKVQKFVLPSFDVTIAMEQSYILLNDGQLNFDILAMYSHGKKVDGAYHCWFGVVKNGATRDQKMKPDFIRGLELTGSVKNGTAPVSIRTDKINLKLQNQHNQTLSDLQESGAQLYMGVYVTNIQSGEIQEAEVHLPIISHKYTMELDRTRSHFLPGYPLDVVVFMHLPDGSPAAGVSVNIDIHPSSGESWRKTTDQEGAVFCTFNVQNEPDEVEVEVTANGQRQKKIIRRASSPSNSYLYLTFDNKIYSVNDLLTINFNTINGPENDFIYYMVLSRGTIIDKGSLRLSTTVKHNLLIKPNMVPSFRLVCYYHNKGGDIVADSVWVDVRDECAIKVKVEQKGKFEPGQQNELRFDLHGQRARVALLAVDKAFYALKADNKLTAKQVFSTMKSYDLGCSYSGGSDSASVLLNAGLSFVSKSEAVFRKNFGCDSQHARQGRSVDLQQEMMSLKSNFTDADLQDCCVHGFSAIPMKRTCQERAARVLLVKTNQTCADAFLKCCIEAERMRQKKMLEDAEAGFGRTATIADIEEFFLETAAQYIRRVFPPSFAFTEFDVNGQGRYVMTLPDSITTWEIQVITLSASTGFCVLEPSEVRSVKDTFVSLKLPYSVKKYEQLSISPVIYNYGAESLQVAVHMEQTEGLCSPGSATSISFVNITVDKMSSQFVSFSAVPMATGSIPITIRLYDLKYERGIDAVQKTLKVQTEGIEQRVGETNVLKLDGKSTRTIPINGLLPDETVPDSSSNIFISMEGDGFGNSYAKNLLSPEKVAQMIVLPRGCLEQTMSRLAPTALALRYLDLSEQWFDLPAGARDEAMDKIEKGYMHILKYKVKSNGSYGAFRTVPYSNWVTALVVKVLSLVAQRQIGQQGRRNKVVPEEEIRQPVNYLLSVQKTDGSFSDPHPVMHRVLKAKDQDASITAFITIALFRSLQFLQPEERSAVEASMSTSTTYLLSQLEELQHPFAVAITAYCLSVCLPEGTDHSAVWTKLISKVTKGENDCYLWTADRSPQNQKNADAITVETTAYALLTAVELGHTKWADQIACWLTTQENYFGGYKSTQDTILALEALSEYEIKKSVRPETNIIAEFTVPGKSDIVTLALANKKEKVGTDLKKLTGNNIVVQLTGTGDAKFKIVKAYYLLEPKDDCDQLSINVTVEGKVKYTAKVIENYDYYDYDTNEEKEVRVPRSAIEWFDARTRNRRDLDNSLNIDKAVTYRVCVSHGLNSSLTGMAIADITLLSGFEAVIEDLDRLVMTPEQYISHYEVSYGRVLIYFNELFEQKECIHFDAVQTVPIGLLQPAPAVFYDYYEPNRKCTVFYSAPQRSKMVSKLCSEDVCQCAERPCHKLQDLFRQERPQRPVKNEREQHACFSPIVDYAYIVEVLSVSVKSNFELYKTNVKDVLRSNGDVLVSENSVRVFAKRFQCKGQLELGKLYLIMGKDGSTTDSNGEMQYLLESNTWVEKKPSEEECKKSVRRHACTKFNAFTATYKMDGCRQ